MGTKSKGRAWFGKIYNKLETILDEVDTFTSQSTLCLTTSDPSGWESVRAEPEEVAEDHTQEHHDRVALPSSKSPSDPPSHQNFDISGVQGDSLKENLSAPSSPVGEILSSTTPLLEEGYCDGNLSPATTLGEDHEPTITDEESTITNTSTPQKFSADKEMEEEVRFELCRDVVSTESLSTRSSLESVGTVETCNEDPVLAALGISMDDSNLVGESSVSQDEEMKEEVRFESCRDVVSTESRSTRSSLESVGTVETCNEDPVLAAFGISMDVSNLNPIATKIPVVPVQDSVATMRSCNEDNPDDVIDGKSDVSSLDTNASFREDPSHVDDNALYAVRVRTKKLRSFKRKILDALTSKRRREKEYEQLAIWFGDADMGSDLVAGEDSEHMEEAIDSKSSQVHESEDSQWELL